MTISETALPTNTDEMPSDPSKTTIPPPPYSAGTSSTPANIHPPSSSSGNAVGAWFGLAWLQIRRALNYKIAEIVPTESEAQKLAAANHNGNDKTASLMRSYLVWRRAVMYCALPILIFSAIAGLATIDTSTFHDPFNGFAGLLLLLPRVDNTILLIGVILAIRKWTDFHASSTRFLRPLWLVSFVMPLLPALFPIEFLLLSQYHSSPDLLLLKITLAMTYAIQLLPVVVTFPAGAVRGAVRIRALLLHSSSVTGWVLVLSAPFYSLLVFVALVIMTQLVGNLLLLFGTFLLVSAPMIYLIQARLYVGAIHTERQEQQLYWTQRVIGLTGLSGTILLIIWALSADVGGIKPVGSGDGALYSYGDALRLIFEAWGRLLITTTVFSDTMLRIAVRDWRQERKRREERGAEIDALFGSLESMIMIQTNDNPGVGMGKRGDGTETGPALIHSASQVNSPPPPSALADESIEVDVEASTTLDASSSSGRL